jgi:hypothetical protein
MRRFVEECQKEWNRLGVSQATANEMAADLEADLAEAEADGVSPEEVLGNGYFDARAFAAEWARERGVVDPVAKTRIAATHAPVRPLMLALIALVSGIVAVVGLLIVVGRRSSSTFAVVSFRHAVARPLRAMFVHSGQFGLGAPIAALGLLLLVAGVVGALVTLRYWARTTHPGPPERERGVGMPIYF